MSDTYGYLLIPVMPGTEDAISGQFDNVPEIKERYKISGEYSFLIKIAAPDFNKFSEAINKVLSLEGILKAKKFVCIDFSNADASRDATA